MSRMSDESEVRYNGQLIPELPLECLFSLGTHTVCVAICGNDPESMWKRPFLASTLWQPNKAGAAFARLTHDPAIQEEMKELDAIYFNRDTTTYATYLRLRDAVACVVRPSFLVTSDVSPVASHLLFTYSLLCRQPGLQLLDAPGESPTTRDCIWKPLTSRGARRLWRSNGSIMGSETKESISSLTGATLPEEQKDSGVWKRLEQAGVISKKRQEEDRIMLDWRSTCSRPLHSKSAIPVFEMIFDYSKWHKLGAEYIVISPQVCEKTRRDLASSVLFQTWCNRPLVHTTYEAELQKTLEECTRQSSETWICMAQRTHSLYVVRPSRIFSMASLYLFRLVQHHLPPPVAQLVCLYDVFYSLPSA